MLKPIIKLSERRRLLDEKTNRRLRIYNRAGLAIHQHIELYAGVIGEERKRYL